MQLATIYLALSPVDEKPFIQPTKTNTLPHQANKPPYEVQ
jgi:hypothetical protein